MKKLLLVFLTFCFYSLYAQQKSQYTQYMQNMQVINPALTGLYNSIYLKSGVRKQWVGLENAPTTGYFTASVPINYSRYYLTPLNTDFGIEDIDNGWDSEVYQSAESHHGAGVSYINDKTGTLSKTTVNLTYAYHLQLNSKFNLSMGIGAGFSTIKLGTDNLNFEDDNEPVLQVLQTQKSVPDINMGLYLYSSDIFIGFSMQQIIKQKLLLNPNYDKSEELTHYFLTAGYRYWFNEEFYIMPSLMLKNVRPLPLSIDLNTKFGYKNLLWIGGSYRKGDSFSANLGITVNKKIDIGYAYDMTTSNLKSVNNGSHEFVLGIKIK